MLIHFTIGGLFFLLSVFNGLVHRELTRLGIFLSVRNLLSLTVWVKIFNRHHQIEFFQKYKNTLAFLNEKLFV